VAGIVDFFSAQSASAAAKAASAVVEGDWRQAVNALGQGAVKGVTIRTQVSPAVTLDPFSTSPPDAPPNPILMFLKPEITVDTAAGKMVMAPYGTPTANHLPWLIGGALVFGIGLVTGIAMIARRFR